MGGTKGPLRSADRKRHAFRAGPGPADAPQEFEDDPLVMALVKPAIIVWVFDS